MSGTRVDGVVVHHAVGAALAQRDRPGEQEVDRADDQQRDHDEAGANGREHRQVVSLRHEVPGWTPVRPRRAPPAPGYDHAPTAAAAPRPRRTAPRRAGAPPTRSAPTRRTGRRRSRTGAPRGSAARPAKVGLGPWFIIPPARPPRHSTRTAYTPSGGSSFCGGTSARLIVGTPSRRPRRSPVPHLAAHLVGPAQHPGRGGQVAAGDRPADPRAGDVLLAARPPRRPRPRRTRARRPGGAGSRRRRSGPRPKP